MHERELTRVDNVRDYVDAEFDEIIKDGDEMQHWLRNPIEEHFFNKERNQKLAKEFELIR